MVMVRAWRIVLASAVLLVLAGVGYFFRTTWLPWIGHVDPAASAVAADSGPASQFGPGQSAGHAPAPSAQAAESAPPTNPSIMLKDAAIANLGIDSKAIWPETFFKSVVIPGMIVERPDRGDCRVAAPVAGIVTRIHRLPGCTIKSGEPLIELRIVSESLHQAQTELFRANRELEMARALRERLAAGAEAVPRNKLIEAEQQIARLEWMIRAVRTDLLNRGLTERQIDQAAQGEYVSKIAIEAPSSPEADWQLQDLHVELGRQVQAGEAVATLANHDSLMIECRAFRSELRAIESSVAAGLEIQVDFLEEPDTTWPAYDKPLKIHHIANTIDPTNRTFEFCLHLTNQSRRVPQGDHELRLWRFRPGQRVRVRVPVEQLTDVYVLPAGAIARTGADAFIFTQNVNQFERVPVRIMAEERLLVVIAREEIPPGSFVVQKNAEWIARLMHTQRSTIPPGYHMHADGSLHKNSEHD